MKPLLTCLLLITSFVLQAKPLPLRFDTQVKADATARVTLPREIPEPEYIWVLVWMPRLLPAEDVLLTDGAKVELYNKQQSEYEWKQFDLFQDQDKISPELNKMYCTTLFYNEKSLTLNDGTNSFFLTSLEVDIIKYGLKKNISDFINNDITPQHRIQMHQEIKEYLVKNDFLNLTCPEESSMNIQYGKREFAKYFLLHDDKSFLFRFLISGFYYKIEESIEAQSKKSYYEWLEDQIANNPDSLISYDIEQLKRAKLVIDKYSDYYKSKSEDPKK